MDKSVFVVVVVIAALAVAGGVLIFAVSNKPSGGSSPASGFQNGTVVAATSSATPSVSPVVSPTTRVDAKPSQSAPSTIVPQAKAISTSSPSASKTNDKPTTELPTINSKSELPSTFIPSTTSAEPTPQMKDPSVIVAGSFNGDDYYHCHASTSASHHLVLLHGASFSKQNWKDKGLLDMWCRTPSLTVTAIDQPSGFNAKWFQELMDGMEQEIKLLKKPVVLVTPSASGWVVTDWITSESENTALIPKYISTWVPVATGSLSRASHDQVRNALSGLDILAIYGDRDEGGRRISQRLEKFANATVVELAGGHPVYLQSPKEFVRTVNEHLGLKLPSLH